jgi:hypothetical protein
MPTYITRGPAKITITELGGPGGFIALIVLAGLIFAAVHRYARTIGEAAEITAAVLFAVVVAAVAIMGTLLARRIARELRPARPAQTAVPAGTRPPQLARAKPPALPAPDEITVRPEWVTRRGARP